MIFSPHNQRPSIADVFLNLLLLILITGCRISGQTNQAQPSEANRPNVVVIMADDLGYGDIGPFGGWVKTPHLAKLAQQGVRLTDFHSNGPVCSPTRAALMTGRYQQRAGIPGVVVAANQARTHNDGMQPSEYTFAEAMSDAGYATGMFGKWHLGYYRPYNPIHHGFDRFRGFVSGNIDYFSKVDQGGNYDWWMGDQLINEQGYVPHLLSGHATEFIRDHAGDPFFLYVAHGVPHYPYLGPEDTGFRVPGQGRKALDDDQKRKKRAYREMVKALDRSVGRIMKTLKQEGVGDRTFIFFCSDNGATGPGSNGALRSSKGHVFEGGHRVPAIARYPGHIDAGSTTDETVMSMDVMPTAVELAGATLPEDHRLDGIDVMPALTGGDLPERDLIWSYQNRAAIRRGPWKLVLREDDINQSVLFHLERDRDESNDLSDKHPDRVKQLRKAFKALHSDATRSAPHQPVGQQPPSGALKK